MREIPSEALAAGFSIEPAGSHTSRTMMLPELRALLQGVPATAVTESYRTAVVEDNVLGKGTLVTRRASYRFLRELYGLNPDVLLFRALRDLWDGDPVEQPLLAVLCAAARDPLLRATADRITAAGLGDEVTKDQMVEAINQHFPERYRPNILARISRNTLSSWRQSGHVAPAPRRERRTVEPGVRSVAYALLLGYLCGARGEMLFDTFWTQMLDATPSQIRDRAATAGRQGWLEYRQAGGVTEISFRHLLRAEGTAE